MTEPPTADPRHLRPYRPEDLDAIYEIAARTGAAGEDATPFLDDPRLVGHLWAAPYVTLEPELATVLDDGTGRAIGYVIGTLDALAFEERCEREWWPARRADHPLPTPDDATTTTSSRPDRFDDLLIALLHHRPPPDREAHAVYPAELHIDLLPEGQGGGSGRRMIVHHLDALRAAGSPGVFLGTDRRNTRAIGFYRHLGFVELAPERTSGAVDFGMTLSGPPSH
jgi:ribosomal protein S18 acetylase RimI-like enzyme